MYIANGSGLGIGPRGFECNLTRPTVDHSPVTKVISLSSSDFSVSLSLSVEFPPLFPALSFSSLSLFFFFLFTSVLRMYRTRIKGSVVGCLFGFIVRYEVIVICISDGVI